MFYSIRKFNAGGEEVWGSLGGDRFLAFLPFCSGAVTFLLPLEHNQWWR